MKKNENHEIYNFSNVYSPDTITMLPNVNNSSYSQKQLAVKLDILSKYLSKGSTVLDLGCGNGLHLMSVADKISHGIGVDFSQRFIDHANSIKFSKKLENLNFITSSFDDICIESSSVDLIYSFSALYYVLENIEKVFEELVRVLKIGGIAILDLGNANSLNKIVSDNTPGIAKMSAYTINFLLSVLGKYFQVIEIRRFQLLPMWGGRPIYLKPVLGSTLNNFLKREYKGKMLDEWVSSLPVLKNFAFRSIVVLKKIKTKKF